MSGGRVKNERAKSSKTIDIVSYALKVSVNGLTCVFVLYISGKKIFKVCELT